MYLGESDSIFARRIVVNLREVVWLFRKEIIVEITEGVDWNEAVKIEVLQTGVRHKSVVQPVTQWPN